MQAQRKTTEQIQGWIIDYLVSTLGVTAALGGQTRLLDLGVDSIEAAGMAEALEGWLGSPVASTLLWDQPTIATLAGHLAGEEPAARPVRHDGWPDTSEAGDHPFATAINRHLARLLSKLGLDKRFVRGQGTSLYDAQGRRTLDFVAAYGALPLGHNPPEIWSALESVRRGGAPNFVQPSYLEAAGELATRLLAVAPAGLSSVTFANSGAEAVEAAIKMCRMATGRAGILSARGSFHGKTLGALSATANAHYHRDSGAPAPGFDTVPFGDAEALREAFARGPDRYAALLLEPIQGEGGIVEPPPGYLARARRLCDEAGVALVFDEVQTGLGRTGAWFACQHEGVVPDALLLAKALGGGLMPIGAVLAARSLDSETFGLRHSSTFAGGGLACAAGLATLDRLGADGAALIGRVAEHGRRFKQGLEQWAARYPHLVSEVRGRGFLLGLRFAVHGRTWPSSLLAVAAEEGGFAPIFAGYMLNVEGVRLAPTLNGTDVIRIEPPLSASWAECEAVLEALGRGLEAFSGGDAGRVLHGIRTGVDRPSPGFSVRAAPRAAPRHHQGDGRFGFLVHPLDLRSYADFDPSLATLDPEALEAAARCVHGLATPAVASVARITSAAGASAYGEFVLVGYTAAELAAMPHDRAVEAIGEAVELARDRGARIVGLGAFTSIVTQGGLAVRDRGVPVTSGNAYTVVAAHDALTRVLADPEGRMDHSVAVIGAGGAVGRALCTLLAPSVERLILVGRPRREAERARAQLLDVAAAACRAVVERAEDLTSARGILAARILADAQRPSADAPKAAFVALAERLLARDDAFVLTCDAGEAARRADAVVTATSATEPLLHASDLRPGAVVCEISRPHNLGPEVRAARPDVRVIDGGIVALPGRPEIGAFGLKPGHGYACMAETILLALEQRYESRSLGGVIEPEDLDTLRTLAARHGFGVVVPPSSPAPSPNPDRPSPSPSHGSPQHLP